MLAAGEQAGTAGAPVWPRGGGLWGCSGRARCPLEQSGFLLYSPSWVDALPSAPLRSLSMPLWSWGLRVAQARSRGQDAHHVEKAVVWEDTCQDLGSRGRPPPHECLQVATSSSLAASWDTSSSSGGVAKQVLVQGFCISHMWSGLVGRAAITNPFFGRKLRLRKPSIHSWQVKTRPDPGA